MMYRSFFQCQKQHPQNSKARCCPHTLGPGLLELGPFSAVACRHARLRLSNAGAFRRSLAGAGRFGARRVAAAHVNKQVTAPSLSADPSDPDAAGPVPARNVKPGLSQVYGRRTSPASWGIENETRTLASYLPLVTRPTTS